MSFKRLHARIDSAACLGVFRLPGHDLRFHKASVDGSGKCDAFHTEDESDFVLGVLYEIDNTQKRILDRVEALGRGYDEKTVSLVDHRGNSVDAELYIASNIDITLKPYHWYKEHVLYGACNSGLPAGYIEQISAVEHVVDEDAGRALKELSIYKL